MAHIYRSDGQPCKNVFYKQELTSEEWFEYFMSIDININLEDRTNREVLYHHHNIRAGMWKERNKKQ